MNANQKLCCAFERLAKAVNRDLEGTHAPSSNPTIALVHWVDKLSEAPCWEPLEEFKQTLAVVEEPTPKPRAKAVKPKPKAAKPA